MNLTSLLTENWIWLAALVFAGIFYLLARGGRGRTVHPLDLHRAGPVAAGHEGQSATAGASSTGPARAGVRGRHRHGCC